MKLMHYFLRGASRRRRFGGFTLLELLVVIVIIGLLAGSGRTTLFRYRREVQG